LTVFVISPAADSVVVERARVAIAGLDGAGVDQVFGDRRLTEVVPPPAVDAIVVEREEILERLADIRDGVAGGNMYPVDRVVSLASRSEASGQKLNVLLEVEIESISASSPWDGNPGGPIVLDEVAHLLDPESGAELFHHRRSNEAAGDPLDWEFLEHGDIEGLALTLTNDLRVAAESLPPRP
jgi:hypothetical protein